MKTILIATLGGSHNTVVNAIIQQNSDFLWIVCTAQSENRIPRISDELKKQQKLMPPLKGTTLVLHDNLDDVYGKMKQLLSQLHDQYVVTFDLTGGTVPMSLGVWEASKSFPDMVVTWIDNANEPVTHILVQPSKE